MKHVAARPAIASHWELSDLGAFRNASLAQAVQQPFDYYAVTDLEDWGR